MIDEFAPLLDPGDILIDAGNAHFRTLAAARPRCARGIHFVGSGISGGEEGALHGPCIMPGGIAESYEVARADAGVDLRQGRREPCCTHIGSDGAGHFVKMVHNGIEYADMQLIAEAYDLLRRGAGMQPGEIARCSAAGTSAGWSRT